MQIEREQLSVLLNALYDAGEERITVAHPSEDIGDLVTIHLEDDAEATVTFEQGPTTYHDRREDVRRAYGDGPAEDLPDPNEFLRSVVGTGLVPPENQDEIEAFLDRHTHPDLHAGHRPVMIGIDQNLLGHRIPEMLDIDPRTGSTDGQDRPPTTGYALSTGVREELDWKFTNHDTRELEAAFGEEFDRVENQPKGDRRRGLLGAAEYRARLAYRGTDEVESDRGDEAIVDAYADYDEGNRKRVMLFSNDYGFVERAHEADVWAQHVDFPVDLPRTAQGSWEQVTRLVYVLSVLFGVVTLPKVTVFGVWTGKDGLDWQEERLECDVRSPVVAPEIERDLELVRAFGEL